MGKMGLAEILVSKRQMQLQTSCHDASTDLLAVGESSVLFALLSNSLHKQRVEIAALER
jgi:hypothetical protein